MADLDRILWREDTDPLRLGVVVDRLKDRVDVAIVQRDDQGGSEAHGDLVSAEWRLRQAQRRQSKVESDNLTPVSLDGSKPALRPCSRCASRAGLLLPAKPPHGEGVRCATCGKHLGWLPKPRDSSDDFDVIERS